MSATVPAPAGWVESVSRLRLPPQADRRLQDLMDRNTEGQITPADREELESLVEWSEAISLIRAEALHLLGTAPE